jgi:hypothetical protein
MLLRRAESKKTAPASLKAGAAHFFLLLGVKD